MLYEQQLVSRVHSSPYTPFVMETEGCHGLFYNGHLINADCTRVLSMILTTTCLCKKMIGRLKFKPELITILMLHCWIIDQKKTPAVFFSHLKHLNFIINFFDRM